MTSGRTSRRKGQNGEREVRDILRAHGFTCNRDGRLDTDLQHDCHGYHFEIKRRERLDLPGWLRQAETEANGNAPVVVYRSSGQPWRAVLPFDELARLLAVSRDLEAHAQSAVGSRQPVHVLIASPGEVAGSS